MYPIHIAFAVNEAFFPYTCVAVQSIIDAHQNRDGVTHIHIITGQQDDCQIFQRYSELPNCQLYVHRVDLEFLTNFNHKRFTSYAFLRFFLGDLLPDVERALYLDADVLVKGDLSELFALDLQGKMMGMVEEYFQFGPNYLSEQDIPYQYYYNSGVILFDLKRWREKDAQTDYWNFVKDHYDRLYFPDQDAANALFQEEILPLPWEYNIMVQNIMYYPLYRSSEREKLYGALFEPKIVHFCTTPPWIADALRHPYRKEWIQLAKDHQILITFRRRLSLKELIKFKLWHLYRFLVNRPLDTSIGSLQRRYNRNKNAN